MWVCVEKQSNRHIFWVLAMLSNIFNIYKLHVKYIKYILESDKNDSVDSSDEWSKFTSDIIENIYFSFNVFIINSL